MYFHHQSSSTKSNDGVYGGGVAQREVIVVNAVLTQRCIMRRHFPNLFLGTAPRVMTTKLGIGGEAKGPRVGPA